MIIPFPHSHLVPAFSTSNIHRTTRTKPSFIHLSSQSIEDSPNIFISVSSGLVAFKGQHVHPVALGIIEPEASSRHWKTWEKHIVSNRFSLESNETSKFVPILLKGILLAFITQLVTACWEQGNKVCKPIQ